MFAVASLLTIPLAWPLRRPEPLHVASGAAAVPVTTLWAQLRLAAAEPSYWLLHTDFFTCGFSRRELPDRYRKADRHDAEPGRLIERRDENPDRLPPARRDQQDRGGSDILMAHPASAWRNH